MSRCWLLQLHSSSAVWQPESMAEVTAEGVMWALWLAEAGRAARDRLAEHAGLYLSHQVSVVVDITAHKLSCILLRSHVRTSNQKLKLSLLCHCIDAKTVCHVGAWGILYCWVIWEEVSAHTQKQGASGCSSC